MARKSRKNQPVAQAATAPVYNTALYIRLSVMDAGRDESESVVNQEELLRRYVAEHPELTLKNIFTDNGETGTTFDRPSWNALMRECRLGNINCIVVKDLSRLGRNYIETGDCLERIFPSLGVRLIAVNDRYDSLNLSTGERLVSNLKNLVNDIYAKDISRKVIAAMHTKQKNGEFLGGYAAYGYLKDPTNSKKIVVNPDTAPVVRKIFEMKAEGMGNGAICQRLNSEGIPCPSRYRFLKGMSNKYENCIWIISTVADILRNPLYLGHMTQGKVRVALCEGKGKRKINRDEWLVVQNTHEPIVSQNLYDRANAVFDERTAGYKANRFKNADASGQELLLSGVAFCADCGKALSRKKLKNNSRRVFRCKRYEDLNACAKKLIYEDDLYNAVYFAICTQVQICVDAAEILEKLNPDYESRLMHSEIENAEKEIRRLTALRQAAYDDFAGELLSSAEYRLVSQKYNIAIGIAGGKSKHFIAEREKFLKNARQADNKPAIFACFTEKKVLTREMVQALIKRVEVSAVNRVTVTFKFCDELES
ncbi:MAG: recombinase family protein [Defluviitaleaceae bacterium]|nr:recombinase family protein [Defluviitaleaceae bacterium]